MDYNKYSKDVHTIIDNLSKEESNHIGNGYWVDSNHIIYRKVEYMNNKPVGFIDVYSLPKFKRYGLIIIAVSKEARGKGIGKKLVNSAIQNCKNNKDIDKLRWLADSDNIASINMAKSLGFKLNDNGEDKKEFIYDLRGDENMENMSESTLPSKERRKLDDDMFGIPSLRKYPLNDKAHVLAAIRMFNRVDRKHEKELAHNIIAAMEKYKISTDIIGPKNRLQSYI